MLEAGMEQLRVFAATSAAHRLRAAMVALRRILDDESLTTAAASSFSAILGCVRRLVVGRSAAACTKPKRTLLVTGYVGSVMERLRLERIVASEEVMSLLPAAMLALSGAPMVVYKYFESVGRLVCNWGAAARAAPREARKCNCMEPHLVPFHGAGVQHVVTKDVRIVENATLRALLSRGVKYRDTFTHLFASGTGDTGTPRDLMTEDILSMVEAGCWKLAEQQSDLNGIDVGCFLPWCSTVVARAREALGVITDEEIGEIMAAADARTRWDGELKAAVKALRNRFVISVADKETSVAVFTCRAYWEARVREEVNTGGVYVWHGGGAQENRAAERGAADTASPCAAPTAPMAPLQQAPPPPPLTPPPMAAPMLEVDEARRILRATHPFGILGDLLCQTLPSDTRVQRLYEEARERLEAAAATARRHGRPPPTAEEAARAEARLRGAFWQLRSAPARQRVHLSLRFGANGLPLPRPVTNRTRCPIDVRALREHAIIWCENGVPLGRASTYINGIATGWTVADTIFAYLERFVTEDVAGEQGIGYVDLEYRHGARTAALVAAGWCTGGREYARGDPFTELRSGKLCKVALRRFGFDFDDGAAYPRAALHGIARHRLLAGMLLRGDNREHIMRALAELVLPPSTPAAEARKQIKRLINLLDMDGTYGGWRRDNPGPTLPGSEQSDGPVLTLPSGDVFHVRLYFRQQPERTAWVGAQRPHLTELYGWWRTAEVAQADWSPEERTLKSDFCAEFEAASRGAKQWWATSRGHGWFSLQHDGVIIGLTAGTRLADALHELQVCCTRVLGYHQPVEQKPMEVPLSPAASPTVRTMPTAVVPTADGAPAPVIDESEYARLLGGHFAWIQARGMLTTRRQTTAPGIEAVKESKLEAFVRGHRLSYLYATVKTHKEVYGWRFIAGGTDISVGVVSDWVHSACKALTPTIDELMMEAVADLPGGTRCRGSWILRDGRGVVARIRALEAGLRAERHGAHGAPAAAGYLAWRGVEFGVHDFTSMYTKLPHDEIRRAVGGVIDEVFARDGHIGKVLKVTEAGGEWIALNAAGEAPGDSTSCKYYTASRLKLDVDFILNNIFVTVGDDIFRQTLGVPMGFSCSPMLAVIMLAFFEIAFVRRLVASTDQPMGTPTDTARGTEPLTAALRWELRSLAVRTACSCRAIDDVLLVNIAAADRRWLLLRMYPASLEHKEEYASPGPIRYLDMEIKHDRGGFYTDLYDKRDVLAAQGKMSSVLKFPHIQSRLSTACKYGCMTSFMHRIHRGVMRRRLFVRRAAERVIFMAVHGYDPSKLLHYIKRFMRANYVPRQQQKRVTGRITAMVHQLVREPAFRSARARRRRRRKRQRRRGWRHTMCSSPSAPHHPPPPRHTPTASTASLRPR